MQVDSSSKSNLPEKKQRGQGERQKGSCCPAWHLQKEGEGEVLWKVKKFAGKRDQTKSDGKYRAVLWLLWKVGAARVDGEETW